MCKPLVIPDGHLKYKIYVHYVVNVAASGQYIGRVNVDLSGGSVVVGSLETLT